MIRCEKLPRKVVSSKWPIITARYYFLHPTKEHLMFSGDSGILKRFSSRSRNGHFHDIWLIRGRISTRPPSPDSATRGDDLRRFDSPIVSKWGFSAGVQEALDVVLAL